MYRRLSVTPSKRDAMPVQQRDVNNLLIEVFRSLCNFYSNLRYHSFATANRVVHNYEGRLLLLHSLAKKCQWLSFFLFHWTLVLVNYLPTRAMVQIYLSRHLFTKYILPFVGFQHMQHFLMVKIVSVLNGALQIVSSLVLGGGGGRGVKSQNTSL
jgi:hypothetical protein